MRKLLLCCSLLVVPASVLAQSSSSLISEAHLTTPKPGMSAQWEAGRKQHSAFHAAQKDSWPVFVWEIRTGENSGSYLSVEPGHHWSDFDAHEAFLKIDAPDVAKNLVPTAASMSIRYYVFREDLSLGKPPATPAKMRTTTYYTVIPEHTTDFVGAVKKINAAVQKDNGTLRPSRVYQLVNGGEVPTFVLITDRASWSDMEPQKSTEALLKDAYGDSGPQVLEQLRRSCSKIVTELSVYRPDLSYIPK
jgi:hypothetical protein